MRAAFASTVFTRPQMVVDGRFEFVGSDARQAKTAIAQSARGEKAEVRVLPHFLNEKVIEQGVPTNQFLTRKLWDAGSSAPYGHRGDLTTLTEAIINHGGEARQSRDAFAGLSAPEKAGIIEFLKSMQVLPEPNVSFVQTSTGARDK